MPIKLSLMMAVAWRRYSLALAAPQAQTRTTLDIYVVDVEGGNATPVRATVGAKRC